MQQNDYALLRFITGITAMALVLSPFTVVNAAEYEQWPEDLPYTDRSLIDVQTAAGLGALTEIGVFRGNDDGTFRADSSLNRAEFVTIIMRLLDDDDAPDSTRCFPDVAENAWYAADVCRAKELGIIRGNADPNMPVSQWRFEPARATNYAEAVKMLVELYALPLQGDVEGADWFVPYINAANAQDIGMDLRAGDVITRGEMARLTARFYAHSKGELDELLAAEMRDEDDQTSSSSSRSTSSTSSTSTSRSSAGSNVSYDPIEWAPATAGFLIAGRTSQVLAQADVFLEQEPLNVDAMVITLENPTVEVEGFLVYDEEGALLGRATYDLGRGTGVYALHLRSAELTIPKAAEYTFYIRGILRSVDRGAQSGIPVEVQNLSVEGTGEWSNRTYTRSTTTSFPVSMTAHGSLEIENAGTSSSVLVPGTNMEIGSFRFTADAEDTQTDVQVNDITFALNRTSNVTVSNVTLRHTETGAEMDCDVTSTTIVCEDIPDTLRTIDVDTPKTFKLFANVEVTTGNAATLGVSISNPGSATSAGDVTWTDGETTFQWLPGGQPVVTGTTYSL